MTPDKALNEKVVSLERKLEFANTEVNRLQNVLADKERELEEMNFGSQDQDDLVKRHRAEIDQWRKKLKDKDLEREEWIEERNTFLVQIQDLKSQLAAAKANDAGMTAEMINEVHFYQTELDNWKNKCKEYEQVFEELSKINEFLTAQNKEQQNELKEQENKLKDNENIISLLKLNVSQLEEKERASGDQASEIHRLESKIKELERQLADEAAKNQLLAKQAGEIDKEFVDLKLKFDKTNRERSIALDDADDLRMNLELSEKKIQMKEDEIKRLNERIQSMKNEYALIIQL